MHMLGTNQQMATNPTETNSSCRRALREHIQRQQLLLFWAFWQVHLQLKQDSNKQTQWTRTRCSGVPHQILYPSKSKYLNGCATNTNRGRVNLPCGVTTSTICFEVSSRNQLLVMVFSLESQPYGSAGQAFRHVFPSGGGEHAWRENRPSEEHVWTGLRDNIDWATVG